MIFHLYDYYADCMNWRFSLISPSCYENTSEIDERTNGIYHPDTANTYDYVGRTKQALGDLDGALEMFNKNL